MLATIITQVLNRTLGSYIEGLDRHQLKLSVWNGEVSLKNLSVQPSALDFLKLPVVVKAGTVGHLFLKANWAKLTSEPVQILLDEVLLSVRLRTPEDGFPVDDKAQKQQAAEETQKLLAAQEGMWMEAEKSRVSDTKNDEKDPGFITQLVTKIANNVQITVKNVHIRYEDDINSDKPLALGMILHELTAFTVDREGKQTFTSSLEESFKDVKLTHFAVYCNTGIQVGLPLAAVPELLEIFASSSDESRWHYLLYPVSGTLNAVIHKDVFPVSVKASVDALQVYLSRSQYESLLGALARLGKTQAMFAAKSEAAAPVLRSATAEERTRYTDLYKRTLNADWLDPLSSRERKDMETLEKEVSYDDLIKLRYAAFVELRQELHGGMVTKRKDKKGWLWSWFGTSSEPDNSDGPEEALTQQDRELIEKQIAFDPSWKDKENKFPPDFVKIALDFALHQVKIGLLDENRKPSVELEGSMSTAEVKVYPAGVAASLSLAQITGSDYHTSGSAFRTFWKPAEQEVPRLGTDPIDTEKAVSQQPERKDESSRMMRVSFESKPLDGTADTKVAVKLVKQEIVLHGPLLGYLGSFFTPPKAAPEVGPLTAWSAGQLSQLRASTSLSLAESLERHQSMAVSLDVAAPCLILPSDPCLATADVMVVDLGHLNLATRVQSREAIMQLRGFIDIAKSEIKERRIQERLAAITPPAYKTEAEELRDKTAPGRREAEIERPKELNDEGSDSKFSDVVASVAVVASNVKEAVSELPNKIRGTFEKDDKVERGVRSTDSSDAHIESKGHSVEATVAKFEADQKRLAREAKRLKKSQEQEELEREAVRLFTKQQYSQAQSRVQAAGVALNVPESKRGNEDINAAGEVPHDCYDRFIVSLRNMEIFLLKQAGSQWKQVRQAFANQDAEESQWNSAGEDDRGDRLSYLLRPLSLTLHVDRSIAPEVSWLPSLRVKTTLPQLSVCLSPSQFAVFMSLASQMKPQPTSDQPDRMTLQMQSTPPDLQNPLLVKKKKKLSLDELVFLMGDKARAAKIIERYDVNESGYLERSEYEQWYQDHVNTLQQNVSMICDVTLPYVGLTLCDDDLQPILSLNVEGIYAFVQQTQADMTVTVSVKALVVKEDIKSAETPSVGVDTDAPVQTESVSNVSGQSSASAKRHSALLVQAGTPSVLEDQTLNDRLGRFLTLSYSMFSPSSLLPTSNEKVLALAEIDIGPILITLDPAVLDRLGSFFLTKFMGSVNAQSHLQSQVHARAQTTFAMQSQRMGGDAQAHPELPSPPEPTMESKGISPEDMKHLQHNLQAHTTLADDSQENASGKQSLLDRVKAKVTGMGQEDAEKSLGSKQTPLRVPRRSLVAMRVKLKLHGFKMLLTVDSSPLAELYVGAVAVSFDKFASSFEAAISVGQIGLKDLSFAASPHAPIFMQTTPSNDLRILSPPSAQTFASPVENSERTFICLKYMTYSQDESDFPGYTAEVEGEVHGLRIVFLQRFIAELTLFFTAGPMGNLMQQASGSKPNDAQLQAQLGSTAPAQTQVALDAGVEQLPYYAHSEEAAKRQSDAKDDEKDPNAQKKADSPMIQPSPYVFMPIKFILSDVEVVVPVESFSAELFSARIDKLTITHQLKNDEDQSGKEREHGHAIENPGQQQNQDTSAHRDEQLKDREAQFERSRQSSQSKTETGQIPIRNTGKQFQEYQLALMGFSVTCHSAEQSELFKRSQEEDKIRRKHQVNMEGKGLYLEDDNPRPIKRFNNRKKTVTEILRVDEFSINGRLRKSSKGTDIALKAVMPLVTVRLCELDCGLLMHLTKGNLAEKTQLIEFAASPYDEPKNVANAKEPSSTASSDLPTTSPLTVSFGFLLSRVALDVSLGEGLKEEDTLLKLKMKKLQAILSLTMGGARSEEVAIEPVPSSFLTSQFFLEVFLQSLSLKDVSQMGTTIKDRKVLDPYRNLIVFMQPPTPAPSTGKSKAASTACVYAILEQSESEIRGRLDLHALRVSFSPVFFILGTFVAVAAGPEERAKEPERKAPLPQKKTQMIVSQTRRITPEQKDLNKEAKDQAEFMDAPAPAFQDITANLAEQQASLANPASGQLEKSSASTIPGAETSPSQSKPRRALPPIHMDVNIPASSVCLYSDPTRERCQTILILFSAHAKLTKDTDSLRVHGKLADVRILHQEVMIKDAAHKADYEQSPHVTEGDHDGKQAGGETQNEQQGHNEQQGQTQREQAQRPFLLDMGMDSQEHRFPQEEQVLVDNIVISDDLQEQFAILAPFTMELFMTQFPSVLLKNQSVLLADLVLDSITLRFTYKAFHTLTQCMSSLSANVDEAKERQRVEQTKSLPQEERFETEEPNRKLVKQEPIVVCGKNELDRTFAVIKAPPPASESAAVNSFGDATINVIIRDGIFFHVINDSLDTNLPIARLLIEDASVRIHGMSHHRTLAMSFSLSAAYFNNHIVEWEPMIEPWSASLSVIEHIDTLVNNVVRREVSISSRKNLEVNFTESMVSGAVDAITLFKKAEEGGRTSDQAGRQFRFTNGTEFDILVEKVSNETQASRLRSRKKTQKNRLQPEEKVKAELGQAGESAKSVPNNTDRGPDVKDSDNKFFVKSHSYLPFNFFADQWQEDYSDLDCYVTLAILADGHNLASALSPTPLRLCISRTGVTKHRMPALMQEGTNAAPVLVCEVHVEEGVKVISLHSDVGISNDTEDSILVMLLPDGPIDRARNQGSAQIVNASDRLDAAIRGDASASAPSSAADGCPICVESQVNREQGILDASESRPTSIVHPEQTVISDGKTTPNMPKGQMSQLSLPAEAGLDVLPFTVNPSPSVVRSAAENAPYASSLSGSSTNVTSSGPSKNSSTAQGDAIAHAQTQISRPQIHVVQPKEKLWMPLSMARRQHVSFRMRPLDEQHKTKEMAVGGPSEDSDWPDFGWSHPYPLLPPDQLPGGSAADLPRPAENQSVPNENKDVPASARRRPLRPSAVSCQSAEYATSFVIDTITAKQSRCAIAHVKHRLTVRNMLMLPMRLKMKYSNVDDLSRHQTLQELPSERDRIQTEEDKQRDKDFDKVRKQRDKTRVRDIKRRRKVEEVQAEAGEVVAVQSPLLAVGQTLPWHASFDADAKIWISCQIPALNEAWGDWVELEDLEYGEDEDGDTEAVTREHKAIITDVYGRQLAVHIGTTSKYGHMEMQVYVPYWVFNFTRLPLVVSEDKAGKVDVPRISTLQLKEITHDNATHDPSHDGKKKSLFEPATEAVEKKAAEEREQERKVQRRKSKEDIDREWEVNELTQAMMFSYLETDKKKVYIGVDSHTGPHMAHDAISFASTGTEGSLVITQPEPATQTSVPTREKGKENDAGAWQIGYEVTMVSLHFNKTKLVTFTPRYLIFNHLPCDINIKQAHDDGQSRVTFIKSNDSIPFHWPYHSNPFSVSVLPQALSSDSKEWSWSSPLNLDSVGSKPLHHRNYQTGESYWFKANITAKGPTVYVRIEELKNERLKWELPYQIHNFTARNMVRFRQTPRNEEDAKTRPWIMLRPYSQTPYSWEHEGKEKDEKKHTLEIQLGYVSAEKGEVWREDLTFHAPLHENKTLDTVNIPPPPRVREGAMSGLKKGVREREIKREKERDVHLYVETIGSNQVLVISDTPQHEGGSEKDRKEKHKKQTSQEMDNAVEDRMKHIQDLRLADLERERKQLEDYIKFTSTQMHDTKAQLEVLKAEEVLRRERPAGVSPESSQVHIDILRAEGLPLNKNLFCEVAINDMILSKKTQPMKHKEGKSGVYEWLESFVLPPPPFRHSSIFITICERTTGILASTKRLAYCEIPLKDFIDGRPARDYRHPLKNYESKRYDGIITLNLWWLPASFEVLERRLERCNSMLSEQRRVYSLLGEWLPEKRKAAEEAQGVKAYEYTVELASVRSVAAAMQRQRGIDVTKGEVTCVVECPAAKSRASFVLFSNSSDATDDQAENGQEDVQPEQQSITNKTSVNTSVCHDRPPTVTCCDDLKKDGVVEDIDRISGFHLTEGENLLCHVNNSPSRRRNDKCRHCVLLTSNRLLKVRNYMITGEWGLKDIGRVSLGRSGALKRHAVNLTLADGRSDSLPIRHGIAAAYFVRIVEERLSPSAQSRLKASARIATLTASLPPAPAGIVHGDDLKKLELSRKMRKRRVPLWEGEQVDYIIDNRLGHTGSITRDCVLLTSDRLLEMSGGKLKNEISRDEIYTAEHIEHNLKKNVLLLTLSNYEEVGISVKKKEASEWMVELLREDQKQRRTMGACGPSDDRDAMMEAFLIESQQKVQLNIPSRNLSNANVTFKLFYRPYKNVENVSACLPLEAAEQDVSEQSNRAGSNTSRMVKLAEGIFSLSEVRKHGGKPDARGAALKDKEGLNPAQHHWVPLRADQPQQPQYSQYAPYAYTRQSSTSVLATDFNGPPPSEAALTQQWQTGRLAPFVPSVVPSEQLAVAEHEQDHSPDTSPEQSRTGLEPSATSVQAAKVENMSILIKVRRTLAPPVHQRPLMRTRLLLPRIGLSAVNKKPEEILYLSLHDIYVRHEMALSQQTVEAAIGHLQVDNQQPGFKWPVLLAPTPVGADAQPFLQISLNKVEGQEFPANVFIFRYFSLLMQAVDIKIEEKVIYSVMNYAKDMSKDSPKLAQGVAVGSDSHTGAMASATKASDIYSVMVERYDKVMPAPPMPSHEPTAQPPFFFFHFLQLQPLLFSIWFEVSTAMRHISGMFVGDLIINFVGNTVGNLSNAPLALSGLVIENASGDTDTLMQAVAKHYQRQVLRQLYKLVGSLQFLGNPVGLVTNVGSGVKDFFYMPAQGLVKSPQEFGEGLAKGSLSLVKNTFSSVFNSASAITDTVGRGVAMLSLDDEFLAKRQQQGGGEVQHLGQGVKSGAKRFGHGLKSGFTGVVQEPVDGAKKDGAGGFLKGLGKGLLGVVTKPTSGAVDLASQTLKGIGATPSYFLDEKHENLPVRPQRYIDEDRGRLSVYAPKTEERRKVDEEEAKADNKGSKLRTGSVDAPAVEGQLVKMQ